MSEAKNPPLNSSTDAPGPQPAAPVEILCTYGPCSGDTSHRFFAPFSAPYDHPVFNEGTLSPVAALVGLPLRIWRLDKRPSLSIPRSAALDNQRITFAMIDPSTGFAPMQWQQGVGSVICGRQDRKPLPPEHMEAFWMFTDRLLGLFSDGDEVDPAVEMTPAKFRKFYTSYRRDCMRQQANPERWRTLQAPWEL